MKKAETWYFSDHWSVTKRTEALAIRAFVY